MSVRIAIVDDNVFLQKAIAEKLSFFDDLILKFTAINGKYLLTKLEENKKVYSKAEIELNEFIRRNYPEWNCKEI